MSNIRDSSSTQDRATIDNKPPGPKIVFFATQLYALACGRAEGFGGAETELWNVAQAMARDKSIAVCAVTVTDEIDEVKRFGQLQLVPVPPAKSITYQDTWLTRRFAIIGHFLELFRRLKQQRGDIYFSKLASSEASTVWLVARITQSKFVFRVEHDWETNTGNLENKIFRGSWFWSRLFIFCLRRADLVVAQSEKQKMMLKANFDVDSVIIPNGHLIPPEEQVQDDPEQRPNILWVARSHPMKRPGLFLDLAERMPDVQFMIILAKSSEHSELFNECQARSSTFKNVQFIAGLPPDQLNIIYDSARAFVLTSEAEGFSNVIIEALKNGAPVISFGHNPDDILKPSSGDSFDEPAAGYFTNDSIECAVNLIRRMIDDPAYWGACHKLARAIARDKFSVDHVVDSYRDHFARLLGNS